MEIKFETSSNIDKKSLPLIVSVFAMFAFVFGGLFFVFEAETTTCDASGCTIHIRQGVRGKVVSVKEFIPREDILNVKVVGKKVKSRKGRTHFDYANVIEHRDGREIRLWKSTCFNYSCSRKKAEKIMNGEHVEIW